MKLRMRNLGGAVRAKIGAQGPQSSGGEAYEQELLQLAVSLQYKN
jgi:hypothetical protein